MAIGMFSIPTIREEIVALRQADLDREIDARQLELLALETKSRALTASRAEVTERALSHRHWPLRPAHTH